MAMQRNQGRERANPMPGVAVNTAAAAGKLAPDFPPATGRKSIVRMKMVDWYDPVQLVRTGIEVAISTIFGRHSDYRMLEAIASSSDQRLYFDHTYTYKWEKGDYSADYTRPREQKEIWIDYASDVGDGFNSTYAVAYSLAQPKLAVKTAEGGTAYQTQRGEILIFGGDEVYPTSSRQGYNERLVRPYEAALRTTNEPHPHAYAIPGNHDWYDSLVSFTRLFSARRWFAGWRTQQCRSYFALKLPFGWWLLGPDVQLGSDIDGPQVAYFKEVARHMKKTDRIILCNAEPFWIYEEMYRKYDEEEVYNEKNFRFFEDKVLERKISVFIAGDLHHYRRHEGLDGTQKITAGGGGAFLHPTHRPDVSQLAGEFQLKKSFPDEKTSRKMCWNNFKFPFLHKTFGVLIGFIYFFTAWVVLGNLKLHHVDNFRPAVKLMAQSLFENPFSFLWVVAVFVGFHLFTDTHSKPYRFIAGSLHGFAHMSAIFALGWGAVSVAFSLLPSSLPTITYHLLAGAFVFTAGIVVGSLIMGAYLFVSLNLFGRHSNEAFSSLNCEDYKNFLRLKIEPSGKLTIFPIGIHRVPRRWKNNPQKAAGPDFIPDDPMATEPELIEGPIYISKEPTAMTTPYPARTSLQFTEEMKGFVTFGETDYHRGLEAGDQNNTALMFHLTIKIEDVSRFVSSPRHEGRADGYVRCDSLGGQCRVENGAFRFFVDDETPQHKLMLYRLFFLDSEGKPLTLSGYKDVKDDPWFDPLEIWKDTTTLYTRILRGHVKAEEEEGTEVVAAGIITIHKLDFIKQLTSFRTEGPTAADRAAALANFSKLFLGSLWEVYGRHMPAPD
jgi:hypothetical protein